MHTIGSGAFAVVKLAYHLPTNRRVALKIYTNLTSLHTKAVQSEISNMRCLNGLENFPRLLSDFTSDKEVVLVQEFIQGNSLLKIVQNKKTYGFGEEKARFYFAQIINAVALMHSKGICHRDLKMDNILITDSGKVKIIDFGFSI
jgi:serine/threonine protein kinase